MSLVSLTEILKHATENKYGVAAINAFDIKSAEYIIKAAEIEKTPIIVQFYPGLSKFTPLKYMAFCICDMAKKACVPVAVHLDHSASYEVAVKGIRDGFPSVLVDGSVKSYKENVELTKSVVNIARIWGVTIEAELGHVGSGSNIDDITNTEYYTNINQAVSFVEETGCDCLAIAVGNAHGSYIQQPSLDFNRIQALHQYVKVPLVLHGCSDIPDEQLQKAVHLGISKFNIATEYFHAYYDAIKTGAETDHSQKDIISMLESYEQPLINFLTSKIRLLNPHKFSL